MSIAWSNGRIKMSGATLLRVFGALMLFRFECSGTSTWSLLPHPLGKLDKVTWQLLGRYSLIGVA